MQGTCLNCNEPLMGRQKKYCSRTCKNAVLNQHHQSYLAQQERGKKRKLELVSIKGGCCSRCGYKRNYAALEFHHVNPQGKEFALDLRSLSNRRWHVILKESSKCVLLCSNCHTEAHNPDSFLDQ